MTRAAELLDTDRFDLVRSADDAASAVAIGGIFNITQGPISDPSEHWITLDREGALRLRDALDAALGNRASASALSPAGIGDDGRPPSMRKALQEAKPVLLNALNEGATANDARAAVDALDGELAIARPPTGSADSPGSDLVMRAALRKALPVLRQARGERLLAQMASNALREALEAMTRQDDDDAEGKVAHLWSLTWIAAPRPPAHLTPMTGRQGFPSFSEAVAFMARQAPDARFESLVHSQTVSCDRSEEARAAIPARSVA